MNTRAANQVLEALAKSQGQTAPPSGSLPDLLRLLSGAGK